MSGAETSCFDVLVDVASEYRQKMTAVPKSVGKANPLAKTIGRMNPPAKIVRVVKFWAEGAGSVTFSAEKQRQILMFRERIYTPTTIDLSPTLATEWLVERARTRIVDAEVGIEFSAKLVDGGIFIICERPVQLNFPTGRETPSRCFIIREDGSFEVSRAKAEATLTKMPNRYKIASCLNRDLGARIKFFSPANPAWQKVKIRNGLL